ncbi:DUF2851 family protein [Flavobacteriaceae bacterium TP-CH-4]|uniref:DUF2851 family protein n=1 Tax=Pelagihabitans pacificus TaxID=2696054 RepID=A0A967B287_9FLAO|nr:DUF2851 family protein [Pelagihabitans pacificus]NHF60731.1 DUF2851 family protein [Pelagihabitans pacificus]
MKEDLLHFIWKYKKLQLSNLVTTAGETIFIVDVGTHNHLAGPDFFNSKIEIDGQLWAGNVELHLNSSDWFAHHHERDPNYNNVILHVVWQDDGDVFRSDNTKIPTLQLKDFISSEILQAYQNLFDARHKSFINCEKSVSQIETFLVQNWLDRLFLERLEQKSLLIDQLLKQSKNDWEQVLFILLLKSFGLKINGEAFLELGKTLNFSVVRKLRSNTQTMEAVLLGMSHLLDDPSVFDDYYLQIQKEYRYQKRKFGLDNEAIPKPGFFKLRPPNFPTIRLSQLANVYGSHENLFSKLMNSQDLDTIYTFFDLGASLYWNDHFTFGKSSKKSSKKLSKKFIDLLIINSILPLKFSYSNYKGKNAGDEILRIISNIKEEKNSIISNFGKHGLEIDNAKESQALIQLYNEYCTKNKCLQCAIGASLLQA